MVGRRGISINLSFLKNNQAGSFRNMMRDGLLQSNRIIIDKPDLTERFMRRSIYNRIKNGEDIEEVWLRTEKAIRLIYKKRES